MKKILFSLIAVLCTLTSSAQNMYGWLLGTTQETLVPGIYQFDFNTVDQNFDKVQGAMYQNWGGAGTNDNRYYFLMSESVSGDQMGLYVYDFTGTKGMELVAYTNFGCFDMTYDPSTGWMLGLLYFENGRKTKPYLVVIDLEKATYTKLALLSTPLSAIAADAAGNLIGADNEGLLYNINKKSGECTPLALTPVVVDSSFENSLEYDRSTGRLFWGVLEPNVESGELLEMNPDDGSVIARKSPAGGSLFTGLWVPFTGGVLPGEGPAPIPYVDPTIEEETDVLTVPYSYDFSQNETKNWVAEDANGDGNTWNYDMRREGRGYCYTSIYYSGDDYFISKPFALEEGLIYQIKYTVRACSFFSAESFALTMGKEQTAASQVTVLDEHSNYTSPNPSGKMYAEEPETFTVEVQVNQSCQCTFALHCTSSSDNYELEFHDFSIEGALIDGMDTVIAQPKEAEGYYQLNPLVRVYRNGRKVLLKN